MAAQDRYRSPLTQHWYVPTAVKARPIAHLVSTPPAERKITTAACGERRRVWAPAAEGTSPDTTGKPGYCSLCQDLSARPATPPRGASAAGIPARFAEPFSRYLVELSRAGLSANTRRSYSSRTAKMLRWVDERHGVGFSWTENGWVEQYRTQLIDDGAPAATINAHLTAVQDYLRRSGIATDGYERLAEPVGSFYLRPSQEARLLQALAEVPERDQCVVELLRHGLKVGEVIALDRVDISIREGEPTLRVATGGRGARTVPLEPTLFELLRSSMSRRRVPLLWDRTQTRRLSDRRVHGVVAGLGAIAGITDLTPTTLRITAAAHQTFAGSDPAGIASGLGISEQRATQIMAAVAEQTSQQHRTAIEAMNPGEPGADGVLSNGLIAAAADVLQQATRQSGPGEARPPITAMVLPSLVPPGTTPTNLARQLKRFVEAHRSELATIYGRFRWDAPTVFVRQPEALLWWRAVSRSAASLPVLAVDEADLRAIWESPAGAARPAAVAEDDW